jgi:aryl-alcohol dehydrogenase-like predicted oxidoreductase
VQTRFLGRSGLDVSVLSFGTMTFGGVGRHQAMGSVQVEEARRMIGICLEAGVNLIDTADIYSLGSAEEVLGAALGPSRKDLLIASKVFARMGPGRHDVGLSRQHIVEACEASLRRLRTDYIDLYQAHGFDSLIPVEETLRAFDDLVGSGKVRYIGSSNFSAWHLMKAVAISEREGLERYIGQQINYSLLAREAENELIPLGLDQGIGVLAWSPLQFGLLSGKFRRGSGTPPDSRLSQLEAPGTVDFERLFRIVDVMDCIAGQRGATTAQVALNWIMRKPGVSSVIIGARNEAQLRDNLQAATWELTAEEVRLLDEASALPLPYPYWHQQKYGAERNPPLPAVSRQPVP